ncbi:MAG: DUF3108 domain-containing protein [Desulfobulbaceae bacterium]|nr:DUF3108 domain-containing protein [Desulfobulbaceae bacterium]
MSRFLLFIVLSFASAGSLSAQDAPPLLHIQKDVLNTIFSGSEVMHYSISWSGGIKIGDLDLVVSRAENGDGYRIQARVSDYGMFRLFYPVDDIFTTMVRGVLKLPYRYEVLQREGHGGRETRRLTLYDQQRLEVSYQKNDQPVKTFTLAGTAYNEFSSFFITRALKFLEQGNVVPTYVDEKRHEVAVVMLGREKMDSIFGKVDTVKIMPKMDFKGLYDKDGDTVFWLTDDACRIPVAINSKILIGSLTAELVEYSNPACPERTGGGNR